MLTDEQRRATLGRFERHRAAWDRNPLLRALYADWYGRVRAELPAGGPWVEIGSGPGFAREFIPGLELTDLVRAPWHDREVAADRLPFEPGTVGALVLFDVLHHLPSPSRFFDEASRVLRPGGRIVLCEPFMSLLSWPVYHFMHEEPVQLTVDPLAVDHAPGKDPFDSNQAIPTVLFGRRRAEFSSRFPGLDVRKVERLAGPSYVASGGFSRPPVLPVALFGALKRIEDLLPEPVFRAIGFRMLVAIERR